MTAVSPLAPARFPELAPIAGVRLAAFACGIRYAGRDDLMLAELAPGSAVAGVFTRSLTAGAPTTRAPSRSQSAWTTGSVAAVATRTMSASFTAAAAVSQGVAAT